MSKHVETAIIDFLSSLRVHAQERQTNGGYRIRVGLICKSGDPIHILTTNEKDELIPMRDSVAVPILEPQPVTIELDPLAPPLDLVPQVSDLALDLINQAGIEHLKIIADSGIAKN